MPLALIFLATLLFIAGVTGNYQAVGKAFEDDVMGSPGPGFLQFMVGLIGIAAFFRLVGMPNAGRVFLILVVLVYVMGHGNAIKALQDVTASGSSATQGQGSQTATPQSGPGRSPSGPGAPLNLPGAQPATPTGSTLPEGGSGTH